MAGAYQWQDLAGLGVNVDRNQLCAKLIDALIEMLSGFSVAGFEPMAERWNALSSYANKVIRVGAGDDYVQGMMEGVDASGALLVRDSDGVQHQFLESTVSVRLVS